MLQAPHQKQPLTVCQWESNSECDSITETQCPHQTHTPQRPSWHYHLQTVPRCSTPLQYLSVQGLGVTFGTLGCWYK